MNSKDQVSASRRGFLKGASGVALAGIAAPWTANLAALAHASAAGADDYKALVCIFLYGGNDYANTVVCYDPASHARYVRARPTFAYSRESLGATALEPVHAPQDANGMAHQYALAPALAPLHRLFSAGKMGVVLNVGTLVEPTSKLQWTNSSVRLPPRLLSHSDQHAVWESGSPEGGISGWGGRMGDLFMSDNVNATFTCINLSGNSLYLSGTNAIQYQVAQSGAPAFYGLSSPLFGSASASAALRTLITEPRRHMLENEYNRVCKRSLEANQVLGAALSSSAGPSTPFPSNNSLADELKMVARIVGVAPALGVRRQVFLVAAGGFDNHDRMLEDHPILLANLAGAMSAFYAATVELGVADKVTAFTASEFGRTLNSNGNGTDHGWGSMHFVMGGAVQGKRFYGTAPIVADDGPDDIGQGRLLPTTSVEQLAATLGAWLGVSDSDLLDMLPNLANFNPSVRKLGFV